MLERFKLLLKLEEKEGKPSRTLKHLAITTHGMEPFAREKKKPPEEVYKKSFQIIKELIDLQIKNKIPILTIYLLPEELKKEEVFSAFLDEFIAFFNSIKGLSIIHDNKIKISALGKWYDLPGRAVEPIKNIIEETKDYDNFFLNFCINYNGQEEIVDACKMIARQIKADKLDVDSITKETIKDNVYSSYFLPPNLIIKNGKRKQTSGVLLWDSIKTDIYFTEKYFPRFTKSDFSKAIEQFSTAQK
jgi:undecaprenyl diphosphate synthase